MATSIIRTHLSTTDLEELSKAIEVSARLRECKFVNPFPEEVQVECSICIQILKEPQMISCCGHRFCLECIKKLFHTCPLCKATRYQYYPDKALKRQINQRAVFCLLRKDGCMWTGELCKITDHLDINGMNENPNPCQYFPARCPYCFEHVRRKDMEAHRTNCKYRPSKCKFCSRDFNYKRLMDHYKICPAGPVFCMNAGCPEVMSRTELNHHLGICKWSPLDCPYDHAGCTMKVLRKDMTLHMEKNKQRHLDLLNQKCKKLEERELELKRENAAICHSLQNRIDELEIEAGNGDSISFLVISDLPFAATIDEHYLKSRFGQYGHIANVLLLDSSFEAAIVVYSSSDSYQRVIIESRSKGIRLCKKKLQVNPVYTAQADKDYDYFQ